MNLRSYVSLPGVLSAALPLILFACGGTTVTAPSGLPEEAGADAKTHETDGGSNHRDATTVHDAGAMDATPKVEATTPVDASPTLDGPFSSDAVVHFDAIPPGADARPPFSDAGCPAAQPEAGSVCEVPAFGGFAACSYGATDCSCAQMAWKCGACPSAQPADNAACTVAGEQCAYDAGTCRCGREMGMGMGGGNDAWRCGTACPTTQPEAGAACTQSAGTVCAFDAGTCVCRHGAFFCN